MYVWRLFITEKSAKDVNEKKIFQTLFGKCLDMFYKTKENYKATFYQSLFHFKVNYYKISENNIIISARQRRIILSDNLALLLIFILRLIPLNYHLELDKGLFNIDKL